MTSNEETHSQFLHVLTGWGSTDFLHQEKREMSKSSAMITNVNMAFGVQLELGSPQMELNACQHVTLFQTTETIKFQI